jgi:putative ABC transport system permease protein
MLIFRQQRHKEDAVHHLHAMIASQLMAVPRDVRYGLRRLNNNVGFTTVAVACLALGICASVTVFSVVNALLLRPVPGVAGEDRLVSLTSKPTLLEGMGDIPVTLPLSYPGFLRYREGNHVFSGLVAYQAIPVNLVMGGEPLRLNGQVVTEDFFTTLGLQPALGRLFVPGEVAREAQPEVVVSHALWQRAFARRRGLGSAVSVNGHPFVVIGVAPPEFRGTQHEDEVDVWMLIDTAPLVYPNLSQADLRDPEKGWLFGFFGRLAPGVDVKRAQKEMDLLAGRLAEGLPQDKHPPALQLYRGLRIRPGARGPLAGPLALLSGVVGLLMLVVCANLGSLLLVKTAARQEEIGVRLALGVTRGQLVRQLLAESVTLSLAGGAVGFVLSLWTVDALQGLSLGRWLPRLRDLAVDGRVAAFTVAISLGAGVLFGLVPALWSTRRQVVPLLQRGGDNSGLERRRSRLQELFVVAQVTVSLMLLITTGLFVRTLRNLQSIDPGFDSTDVLNFRLNVALQRYSEPSGLLFYEQLLSQVRRLPSVRSASLVSWVPLSSGNDVGYFTSVRPQPGAADGSKTLWSQFGVVSPGHLRNLGIPLLRGQDFSPADRHGSTAVLIADETLAAVLWPGRNPIGERVELKVRGETQVREVVGVARGIRLDDLQETPQPYFYLPFTQHYAPAMTLQVRPVGDPMRAVNPIRSVLRRLNPDLGFEVSRFSAEVDEALAQPRLFSWLLGSFSLTALLVTAIGLYGTLAYTVSRRTRELGIRMALGARDREIVAMVLRRGLALTLTGLALGLAAATWATSAFSGLLFGVTPTDPGVFFSVALLLTLVGLAASSLPAYSATRIDPMTIIRHE